MTKMIWILWLSGTVIGAVWLLRALPGMTTASEWSVVYLPGQTSHGHYQIEMKCAACHQEDGRVEDSSCLSCHAQELKDARDTHAAAKFSDPMKAALLQRIDARSCIVCHTEHLNNDLNSAAVTQPRDFCFHCHEDVADDRPSHAGLSFDSCGQAGCHNYHDNTALYEKFLVKHLDDAHTQADGRVPQRRIQQWLDDARQVSPLSLEDADGPESEEPEILQAWSVSGHAAAGVNCSGCHTRGDRAGAGRWVERPGFDSCAKCHESQTQGFALGRHGMRTGAGLSPMTPAQARLPMHAATGHRQLNCASCHDSHRQNMVHAAVDACLKCHDDAHSRNYRASSHFDLWDAEVTGSGPADSGVSCATCHMPRDSEGRVQHNQSATLRPVEKMTRAVCLSCHGLEFSFNALADPRMKGQCYFGTPDTSVKSLQMANDWFKLKSQKR